MTVYIYQFHLYCALFKYFSNILITYPLVLIFKQLHHKTKKHFSF